MIDYGHTSRAGERVTLRPVDDANWRAVADIAPRDEQRRFVAALAARYLLLSMREGIWQSFAVYAGARVVGHAMWAPDPADGAHWIGGVVIDADAQGNGCGRASMLTLIDWLQREHGAGSIKLSYAADNTAAARLYEQLGFELTGEHEGDEVVAQLGGLS